MSEDEGRMLRPMQMGETMQAGDYGLHISDETKMRWNIEARNDLRRDVGEWALELAMENADLAALSATMPDQKMIEKAREAVAAMHREDAKGRRINVLLNDVELPRHVARAAYLGLFFIAGWRTRAAMWLAGEERLRLPVADAAGHIVCGMPDGPDTVRRWNEEREVWSVRLRDHQARLVQRSIDVAYASNLAGDTPPDPHTLEDILSEFVVEQAEARLLYLSTEPWMRAAVIHNEDLDCLSILIQGFAGLLQHYAGTAMEEEKPLLATQIEEAASLVAVVGAVRFSAFPSDEVLRELGVTEWKGESE